MDGRLILDSTRVVLPCVSLALPLPVMVLGLRYGLGGPISGKGGATEPGLAALQPSCACRCASMGRSLWLSAVFGIALIAIWMGGQALDFDWPSWTRSSPFQLVRLCLCWWTSFRLYFCEGVRHALGSICMAGFDYVDWCPLFSFLADRLCRFRLELFDEHWDSPERRARLPCRSYISCESRCDLETCWIEVHVIQRFIAIPPPILMLVDLHVQPVSMH